jgi:hypothetical protein
MFAAPLHLEQGDTVLRDGRFAFTDFRLAGSPHCVGDARA